MCLDCVFEWVWFFSDLICFLWVFMIMYVMDCDYKVWKCDVS